jgi:two-component system response regulator YesN
MDNVRIYTKGIPKFKNRNEYEFEKLYFDAISKKRELGITIQNVTSSIFDVPYKKSILSIKDHSILVILEDNEITLEIIQVLLKELNDKTKQQFSIVISKTVQGKNNFVYAFQNVLHYHTHKFYIGDNAILFEDDNFTFNTLQIDEISYHDQILSLFKSSNFNNLQAIFENFLDYIKQHYIDRQLINNYLQTIFLHLNNSFLKKSNDTNNLINEIIYNISLCESIDTLHILLLNVIHTMYELFSNQQLTRNQYYMRQVDYYIKQHMDEKISLEKLSFYIKFSSSHLSRIIKSETKLTLVPYITKKKMKMAQKLLSNPSLKIKDVAKMVGYEDPLYFNKAFKKEFHQTPKEYRNKV